MQTWDYKAGCLKIVDTFHPQVDFRRLHLRMAQPKGYLAQIAGRLEHQHRTGMS